MFLIIILKKKVPSKYNTSVSKSDTEVSFVGTKEEGKEVYKSEGLTQPPPITKVEKEEEPPKLMIEPADPFDAQIPMGAVCTRKGCKAVFAGDDSRNEPCQFHPGFPIFHEGQQGWSCCKRRTMIFEDFLNFEGCTIDRHKFIPTPQKNENQCKFNFYQSSNSVNLDLYVKNVDSTKSTINFYNNRFTVSFTSQDGSVYSKEYKLVGEIKPEACTYSISKMKVNITLIKQPAKEWSGLFVD